MNLMSMKIPATAVLFLVIAGGLAAQPVSRCPGKGCACLTQLASAYFPSEGKSGGATGFLTRKTAAESIL